MFSSLTLEERNNDPEPYKYPSGFQNKVGGVRAGEWPRLIRSPEFQHGVLPENPILVEFRKTDQNLAPWERAIIWLDDWNKPWFFATDCTLAERAFAHRVLTLLSKIGADL